MKVYVVVTASSNEYGCSICHPEVFKSKREAQKALTRAFHFAEFDMGDDEYYKRHDRNSFEVQNEECSYDDAVGGVFELEIND